MECCSKTNLGLMLGASWATLGTKMLPRCSKMAPETSPKASQRAPRGFRGPPQSQESSQDDPKMAPRVSMRLQNGSQDPPKASQRAPRGLRGTTQSQKSLQNRALDLQTLQLFIFSISGGVAKPHGRTKAQKYPKTSQK